MGCPPEICGGNAWRGRIDRRNHPRRRLRCRPWDGEIGFAPIIEFEFPTRSVGGKSGTVVGFTTKYGTPQLAFNQSFHYDPAEKTVEGSAAVVWRAIERIYPVFEVFGEGGRGKSTIVEVHAGVKCRLPG